MVQGRGTAILRPLPREAMCGPSGEHEGGRVLRVALCVDSLQVGGTELNAVRTAERLPAEGIDVVLLALRAEGPLLERCGQAGIPVVGFPIPHLGSVKSAVRGVALMRLLRRLRIDLIHTQDRYSNAFVVPWARLGGVRVLASRRWSDVHPSRALRLGNQVAYRLAHGVVANSARVADAACRVDGVAKDRVFVVPNFLDEGAWVLVSAEERLGLRARLGVPADALVIGSVANLRPVKDHQMLLAALAPLVSRWPDLVLCLVGDGELRVDLQRQATRLGIVRNVVFAGSRHDPINWHRAFDISVLSSSSEGFPNTIIEAMAAAKPVVATDVGGTPDAVSHEKTGLLVPAGDATGLGRALARLVENPELRMAMGRAGRTEAIGRFRSAVVMPELNRLYRSQVPDARGSRRRRRSIV
jgi:glycosyltransferase involved in cell wall biosynthesis